MEKPRHRYRLRWGLKTDRERTGEKYRDNRRERNGDRGAARVFPPHSGPVERGRALGVHAERRARARRATHHHKSKLTMIMCVKIWVKLDKSAAKVSRMHKKLVYFHCVTFCMAISQYLSMYLHFWVHICIVFHSFWVDHDNMCETLR